MRSCRWSTPFPRVASIVALAVVVGLSAAHAADPVAIVEDVIAAKPTVRFMDYVTSGTVIRLRPADSLVLGYVRSCWRETIRGGVVTVGTLQSTVKGGEVTRQKVECDGGRMRLTPEQAASTGGMIFRGISQERRETRPPVNLYARSPIFVMQGAGLLRIVRSDKADNPIEVMVQPEPSSSFAIYDMATAGSALAAGGTYRASWSTDTVEFSIDRGAAAGNGPIVGRVIQLRGTSERAGVPNAIASRKP